MIIEYKVSFLGIQLLCRYVKQSCGLHTVRKQHRGYKLRRFLILLLFILPLTSITLSAQSPVYYHDFNEDAINQIPSCYNNITGESIIAADNFNGVSESFSIVGIFGSFKDSVGNVVDPIASPVRLKFFEAVIDLDTADTLAPNWYNPIISLEIPAADIQFVPYSGTGYTKSEITSEFYAVMINLPYPIYMPAGWLSAQFVENSTENRSFFWVEGTMEGSNSISYTYEEDAEPGEQLYNFDLCFGLFKTDGNPTVFIDPNGVSSDPDFIVSPGGTIPEELLGPDTGVPAVIYSIQYTGTRTIIVQKPPQFGSDWYCWLMMGSDIYGGEEIIPSGVSNWVFENIAFPSKSYATIVINDNSTLPVELSSFTANLTADLHVKIAWIAESETNHNGYNILRGENEVLNDAIMINSQLIQDSEQQGTQMRYSYLDQEVLRDHQYYYWLESVSLNGETENFGPISVFVTAEEDEQEIPSIPMKIKLISAFPNPFNPYTNIRYSLPEAGDIRIDIFNLKGQLLKSFSRNHSEAGYYQLQWDGKDAMGQSMSSGVYLYRMSSGKYTETKKMVISK